MGKFDGILLCTDLDETLLTTDKKVSAENIKAIGHFMQEGGKFTFSTGRVPAGAAIILDYVIPNAPIVAYNGAGIYDFSSHKMVWGCYLGDDALKILELAERRIPDIGLNVCTDNDVYFCRSNKWSENYRNVEKLPFKQIDYHDIKEPWKKALFITDEDKIDLVRTVTSESEYASSYDFVRSSANYYEILPKGASKGSGMKMLAEILGIDMRRTVALGDNENDVSMVKMAGIGVAVSNAADCVKAAADIITVSNNESAVAKIIDEIESGKIKI